MSTEDKYFLDNNRHFVDSYSQKDPPLKMRMADRERLLTIVRKYFHKDVYPDLWCEPCLQSFVLNSYVFYDEYLKNESAK